MDLELFIFFMLTIVVPVVFGVLLTVVLVLTTKQKKQALASVLLHERDYRHYQRSSATIRSVYKTLGARVMLYALLTSMMLSLTGYVFRGSEDAFIFSVFIVLNILLIFVYLIVLIIVHMSDIISNKTNALPVLIAGCIIIGLQYCINTLEIIGLV